jgi:NAD(P)H-flavin reductase
MPIQYLLSLKYLNPYSAAFRSSHEAINRWHRVLGRLTYTLLVLHFLFYINFFIQSGILQRRLTAPVVLYGITAFICLNLLVTTALSAVRNYSYRLFFVTHLLVAFAIPPLIWFHGHPPVVKAFMGEALLCFVLDLVVRKLTTVASQASLETIPGTNLMKITAAMPIKKLNSYSSHPASHLYLSIPPASRPSSNPASSDFMLFEFLLNPFTVAAVDEETNQLTVVARGLNGPLTRRLMQFADAATAPEQRKVPICLEGPYGAMGKKFAKLTGGDVDRVLLVAGGIGATFAVPLFRAIKQENPSMKVELIWSVRGAGDATWAVSGAAGKSVLDDENVHVFLTGNVLETSGGISDNDNGEIELSTLHRDRRRNKHTSNHNRKRPDLKKVVDDAFKHGSEERIAVLVCGPDGMAKELRTHITPWVMKGRHVLWHNEGFGW